MLKILSTLYLQFVCGGGQQLLKRQSDRLLAAKSQRAESNLEITHYVNYHNIFRSV